MLPYVVVGFAKREREQNETLAHYKTEDTQPAPQKNHDAVSFQIGTDAIIGPRRFAFNGL